MVRPLASDDAAAALRSCGRRTERQAVAAIRQPWPVPEAASTLLLPRAIGHLRAAELLLLGKPIDAETALRWGLVNRVVDDAALMGIAGELTSDIVTLPPAAVRRSKALLKDDQPGVAQRIEREGIIFLECLRGPEFQEAGTGFLDKRPANFSRFQ